jgi:hypothetical protein
MPLPMTMEQRLLAEKAAFHIQRLWIAKNKKAAAQKIKKLHESDRVLVGGVIAPPSKASAPLPPRPPQS